MANKEIPIHHIGISTTAPGEQLLVNFNKKANLTSGIVAIAIFVGGPIISAFWSGVSLAGIFLITLVAGLIIAMIMKEHIKPNPWLTVGKEGLIFYGTGAYRWEEVIEVVQKVDVEGDSNLLVRFTYHDTMIMELGNLDQDIDTIAAYINKYWKRSWE